MPHKLSVRIKDGRCEVVAKVVPDLDEAKRLWMEGKSAQWIMEQARKRAKSDPDE